MCDRVREARVVLHGGLLPSGEFPLPRDYDWTCWKPSAACRARSAAGAFRRTICFASSLVGADLDVPSLVVILRKTPPVGIPIRVTESSRYRSRKRVLIEPGDVILLQQTPSEAVTR